MEPMAGRTLGPYRIMEQIGIGGMATVYKAYHPALDREVAVKILPAHLAADPTFLERFRREARAVAKLEHPHILPVYDFGQEGNLSYLVMRYVPAGTLREELGKPLDLARVVNLIKQIASALDQAHEQGIIHRDVKPSNVLLDRGDWALLTDFGVARMMEGAEQLTATGVGVGTPAYMSPEQGMGKRADRRSDVYSLGVMLYEMLVGKVPFRAETPMAVLLKHIHDPLPLPRSVNPDIPEAIERVVLKAMAKDPEDRFQTAGDLAKALEAASRAEPISTQPATQVAPPSTVAGLRFTKAYPIVGVLVGFAVVVGLGIAAFQAGLLGGGPILPSVSPVPTEAPVTPVPTRAPRKVIGIVFSTGGINDRGFNASAWRGVEDAMAKLGIEGKFLEGEGETEYASNIRRFMDDKVDLIITIPGWAFSAETGKVAMDSPDRRFALTDWSFPDCSAGQLVGKDCGSEKELPNVLGITFAVHEPAFLAGYLAAGVTNTGKVGTFGGIAVPGVTDFMDGYALGVQLYNQKHGGDVVVLGWDPYAREGLFIGNFDSAEDGRDSAQSLMRQGADIIMPLAGPNPGEAAAAAMMETGKAYMIGPDTDWALTAPAFAEITLTSAQKMVDLAVFETIKSVVEGTFSGGTYVGTLANGGVGIAPYHRLDEEVPIWLQNELEDVRQGIIAGTIQTKP